MSTFQKFKSDYEQAIYQIINPHMELHVGVFHPAFYDFLMINNVDQWAMITACNPESVILSESENKCRQNALEKLLLERGYLFRKAEHRDPDGHWPVEPSFFVETIECQEAKSIGALFGQNAILAGNKKAIPCLFSCGLSDPICD
jgi:hypothetical protein